MDNMIKNCLSWAIYNKELLVMDNMIRIYFIATAERKERAEGYDAQQHLR